MVTWPFCECGEFDLKSDTSFGSHTESAIITDTQSTTQSVIVKLLCLLYVNQKL